MYPSNETSTESGNMNHLMLNLTERSQSFDENELLINKQRKKTDSITVGRDNKQHNKDSPTLNQVSHCMTAFSSQTTIIKSTKFKTNLQTDKLVHITEMNGENIILQEINKLLNKSKKIVLLTGAGISCNAGIPDFRSAGGLYNLVKKEYPDVNISSGQDMFDLALFRDEAKISCWATFMERLYSDVQNAKPTRTHRFIAHLKNRNKMLRCYTQNIDGLEELLGLETSSRRDFETQELHNNSNYRTFQSKSRMNGTNSATSSPRKTSPTTKINNQWKNYDVVQLHGNLNSLACTKCFQTFEWSRSWGRSFRRGELPSCPTCEEKNYLRSLQGKRVIDNIGILRPNIVLYGENHPSGDIISHGLNFDIRKGRPDFFIIMGTSLKVHGVKRLVKDISKEVHERGGLVLLINKTTVGDSSWAGIIDYQISEDCDDWVNFLEEEIPELFKTQKQIDRSKMLKREASELRKKAKLARAEDKNALNTPPTTPVRVEDLKNSSLTKNEIKLESDNLKKVKRQLIAPNSERNGIQSKKMKT